MPLHTIAETDLGLILPWRNAPAVCRNCSATTRSRQPITVLGFNAYAIQQDPGTRWYLYR